jgi:Fe-S oxidoreductase
MRPLLQEQLQLNVSRCTQCRCCVAECRFLKRYGDPKQIAETYNPEDNYFLGISFECSLCGLCTAVCPEQLDPVAMFIEMRREAIDRGEGDYPEHRGLRAYERKGTSKRYSWYALPEGCDTIFFPGCGLPGTRAALTLQVFGHLQGILPNVGIVLDCCTKPSHDLGREKYFQAMFGEMKAFLLTQGIKTVLVACPNCYQVFSEYGPEFDTRTVYEVFNECTLPATGTVVGTVTMHDPCVARFAEPMHASVRALVAKKGVTAVEPRHSQKTTLCCGKGGAVDCVSPELAEGWTQQQVREAAGQRTLTYCTGCAHSLGAHGPAIHVLDLVFAPEKAMAAKAKVAKAKVAKAPFTYFNRLKLKKYLKKHVAAAVTRERTFNGGEEVKVGLLKKLLLSAGLFKRR